MSQPLKEYHWEKQSKVEDCETIECKEYDAYKDFKRDPTGVYVLIKIIFEKQRIEVAVCGKDHKIVKIFSGKKPQDIYNAIFDYEKKNKLRWFQEKTHIAYLGKELKKAELALALGNSAYYQE